MGRDGVSAHAADGVLFHERLWRRDGTPESAVHAHEPHSDGLLGGSVSAHAGLDVVSAANARFIPDRRGQFRAAHAPRRVHSLVPALVPGTLRRK